MGRRQLRADRLARAALGIGIVVAAFAWVLPAIAPYGEVWPRLRVIDRPVLALLAVVGGANLVAPAVVQRVALPGLTLRVAIAVDWVTSAVTNVLPGGSAVAVGLTWTMYREQGLAHGAIARSIVVTGVLDALVKLATPMLALAWLAAQGPVGPGLVQAAVFGAALFAGFVVLVVIVLGGPGPAGSVGSLLDRLPVGGRGWGERLDETRRETLALLRERGPGLVSWTVAGHTNLYVLLVVCLRAVGVSASEVPLAAVLAAFAFGRLVTAVPLTPGGLGVMEVGLIGALAAVGSAPEVELVAAVLLFRFLTFAVPIPLGALSWLAWPALRPARPARPARPSPRERLRR